VHADDIFRAIGRFSVKFRWVVLVVWLVAAFAIPSALPSLASVTQGNNSAFLPASAPSEQAANLAAPFGGPNLVPVPVVAAVSSGTLTAADQAWLTTLATDLGKVPTVVSVHDLGVSAARTGASGQAEQLQVLSNVSQNNQDAQTDLINDLRGVIKDSPPPPGMQAHLAGQLGIQVDQQKQSGNTGNEVEIVAFLFILILLFLIFRSVLAPFITVIPALITVSVAGPIVAELANHGLKVSTLAQCSFSARGPTTGCSWCSGCGRTCGQARPTMTRW
jgi:putative drug exporter of the RND superfamily